MSVIVRKIMNERHVPSSARMVAIVLAMYADKSGRCWPSIKTICDDSGLGERAVSYAIKFLKEDGILDVQKSKSGNIYQFSNRIICGTDPQNMRNLESLVNRTICGQEAQNMRNPNCETRKICGSDPQNMRLGSAKYADATGGDYRGGNSSELSKELSKELNKTPQTPHGGQDGFFAQPEIEVENPAVVIPTKTETRKKSDRLDELFELFYKLYPKKPSGPKNSKRSWKRIVTTETLANQIIDNVRERLVKDIKWVEAIAAGDKTYICAPEVFLNQERWLGEYTKVGSIKPVGGNGRYDQNYEPDDGGGIQQFIPPPKDTRTPEEKAAEQRQIDIEREAVKKRMLERNMSKDAIPF